MSFSLLDGAESEIVVGSATKIVRFTPHVCALVFLSQFGRV